MIREQEVYDTFYLYFHLRGRLPLGRIGSTHPTVSSYMIQDQQRVTARVVVRTVVNVILSLDIGLV